MASSDHMIVAAIDIGTTFSGYAYSYKHEYSRDRLLIHANATWPSGTGQHASCKAPSTVLFQPDGVFHSFGFEAEQHYAELSEDDKHQGWFYFSKFKMNLYNEALGHKRKLNERLKIVDDQGHRMLAIDVFAAAIRYLKQHLIDGVRARTDLLEEDDIAWVLTVPAIWSDAAKQFMVLAAKQAGLREKHVTLALESEAAAVYFNEYLRQPSLFQPRSQYLVMDFGGGTVDVVAHEVDQNGLLTELWPSSGGPWGGTKVDCAFRQFLEDILGTHVLSHFSKAHKPDELDLYREFEGQKCRSADSDKFRIRIPSALQETNMSINNKTLKDSIAESQYHLQAEIIRDKLCIKKELMASFFQECESNVISHLQKMFRNPVLSTVTTIFMAGGFAASTHITRAVKESFPTKRVIVPDDCPQLSVLRGAVLFGRNPHKIAKRRMPFTYGINHSLAFQIGCHKPEYQTESYDGRVLCSDCFKVFIRAGEAVTPGETKAVHRFRALSGSGTSTVEIYKTMQSQPQYTTDEGCELVGRLKMVVNGFVNTLPVVEVTMTFGGTQIEVEAREVDGEGSAHASLDVSLDFLV